MENNDKRVERYKILIDDIRYSKRQQWNITYYILLFHFGLFSLAKLNILRLPVIKWFSLFSAFVATYMLWRFCMDLRKYRNEKDNLHWKLFNEDKKKRKWYHVIYSLFFEWGDLYVYTTIFSGFSWLGYVFLWLGNFDP